MSVPNRLGSICGSVISSGSQDSWINSFASSVAFGNNYKGHKSVPEFFIELLKLVHASSIPANNPFSNHLLVSHDVVPPHAFGQVLFMRLEREFQDLIGLLTEVAQRNSGNGRL